jgi:hypothetical protein
MLNRTPTKLKQLQAFSSFAPVEFSSGRHRSHHRIAREPRLIGGAHVAFMIEDNTRHVLTPLSIVIVRLW